jgi:ATP-dependent DNA helicase DinG
MPGVPLAASTPLVSRFFGPQGLLARTLPGFEQRPAQEQLAREVSRVLERGGVLLAEAGTGTGKTLAYLLPAVELGRRVVVSTGTKNLQEQLITKDIPLLARALGREVSVAVMKGRSNYLCTMRFKSFGSGGTFRRMDEVPLFRAVEAWAPRTRTGDRGEVEDLPDVVDFWREISASSENCIGQSCAEFESCWVTQMRQRAAEADIVVVNHHLLCADLNVKDTGFGTVIPEYDTVVLDEAHLLEDVATQYFGLSVSNLKHEDLVRDVERELNAARIDGREVRADLATVRDRADRLFKMLAARHVGKRLTRGWAPPLVLEEAGSLLRRLDAVRTGLLAMAELPDPLRALADRAGSLRSELEFLLAAEDDGHVYFAETRGRGTALKATPIDVSTRLQELLFSRVRSAVLTSATLAVDGGFDFLRQRLGLAEADELLLPSPFDFAQQALLYLPRRMPDPQSPTFVDRAAEEVEQLLAASQGRAFVLFTSYANMNAVAQRIAGRVPWPLMIQGEAPRTALVEAFRRTPNAVLLATSSFWQGVDVAGEQLSCVIVDKLPFASPADPVVGARIDRIRNGGGNPFAEYQVPVAVLTLKQGLGRLIRSASDRGILAVLDSRIVEKSYGRRFLQSLPPARVVHRPEDYAGFLAD